MSRYDWTYVALKDPNQEAKLVSTHAPFYWEIYKDGEGYKSVFVHISVSKSLNFNTQRLAVPNSDLGLSLGNLPTLRPLSEGQGTRLIILENTPENQSRIMSGNFVPLTMPTLTVQRNGDFSLSIAKTFF
jgi:hypothetical protein